MNRSRAGWRVAGAVLVLAAALSAARPAAAYDPVVPADAFGVNTQDIFHMGVTPGWPGDAGRDPLLASIKASGVDVVRSVAAWWLAEPYGPSETGTCTSDAWLPVTPPGEHCFSWTAMDEWASDLARHGLRWMPTIYATPAWAGIIGGCCEVEPRSDDDFALWVTRFAERYGVGGDFWAAHPELPALPANVYEIWNEQNLQFSWKPSPNPLRYGQLYTVARESIHAVDPDAVVSVGGFSDGGNVPGDFLKQMFLLNPGLEVDAVANHPYAITAPAYISQTIDDLVTFRRTMDEELGLHAVPLYITEVGWSTAGDGSIVPVLPEDAPDGTPNKREGFVKTTDLLMRSNCGVVAYQPHTFYAAEPGDTGYSTPRHPADVETGFGLARQDGTLKASGAAWSATIKQLKGEGPTPPPSGTVDLCPWRSSPAPDVPELPAPAGALVALVLALLGARRLAV